MKILFLVDSYYPESSANTVCSDIFINYFKKQGDQVDILSILPNNEGSTCFDFNGSKIIKFKTYHNYFLEKNKKFFKADNWKDLPWVVRKSVALANRFEHLFRCNTEYNSLDVVNYDDIYRRVVNAVDYKYDIIISCSAPFALHVIASKLLKRGVANRWYPIFLDPFVNNKCLNNRRVNKRKRIAEKTLKHAQNIFVIDGVMEENLRLGFNSQYYNKVIEFTMPNLIEPSCIIERKKTLPDNKILLFYAGLFYDKIRNPSEMLNIINKFPNNYELNIYGSGCEDLVKKYTDIDGDKFKYWGRVKHDICLERLQESNILINLSNTITNQMPSKVFEYISFGKPVINFYFNENDVSLKYFKKYPLAFNINLNNYTEDDIQKLIEFCNLNRNKCLSFDEATQNLASYRAENVCKLIYKYITDGEK